MSLRREAAAPRSALAIHLELSHGPHGAGCRVEFHDAAEGTLALVAVRGWIESVAFARLVSVLEDLAQRGVARLVLEGSCIRHVDYGRVRRLVGVLAGLEARGVRCAVCGLSRHVRDLFELAGAGGHDGFDDATLAATVRAAGEWAS